MICISIDKITFCFNDITDQPFDWSKRNYGTGNFRRILFVFRESDSYAVA